MYILTGTSGEYESQITVNIAVSESKEKLQSLKAAIEMVDLLYKQRKAIKDKYNADNVHRLNAVPQKPFLSKDHLNTTTDSTKRGEINRANAKILQDNYLARNAVQEVINDEAKALADVTVPIALSQEALSEWINEFYEIEEINLI